MPDSRDFVRKPTPGFSKDQRFQLDRLLGGRSHLVAQLEHLASRHQSDVDEAENELLVSRVRDRHDASRLRRVASRYRRFARDVIAPTAAVVARLANAGIDQGELLRQADAIDEAAHRLHERSKKPQGRKPPRRIWLAKQVRALLASERISSSKSADGRLATVLRIVYEAAQIDQPVDLYRDVAAVLPERRRRGPTPSPPPRTDRPTNRVLRNSPKQSHQN
jgi:hypothetical protein